MTNPEKLLTTWTNLKQKLITTLQELKTNHKDNWAVVKHKSSIKQVKVLPTHQLEKLKGSLLEKQSLLQAMDQRKRKSKELLSLQDQTKHDQLKEEIVELEKEINWQESLRRLSWAQSVGDKHSLLVFRQELEEERQSKWVLRQDLIQANEKHDCLQDKLNWLRTLVRAGDLTQLQDLVRSAKI